ncbi:lipid-A-disaccharide synthase [Hoeflea marina]|uniref:Lipid-A-disaccharide synthase n=1 Tax=Hoeflea marina TaxID=274592 RepID=A0A317PTY5_9HYPH|nr:lipid-A-disaccharide synthase [Hoeflea marina]PWW03686.1 lipid-A-disaccharide synthase [Hoeflea marina]
MRLSKLAIIAGEPSGDMLAAELVAALTERLGARPELVGVGGEALQRQGLTSLFDQSELSIIGFSAVIARLPKLIWRIRQTAAAVIAARPDCLIIVDSPDFTHRVARRVRRALPDLKIINYVCPTVWAWKPERAPAMTAYVDHVLSVLPFEPEIVAELGGPPLTYVGHRLMFDPGLLAARAAQARRAERPADPERAPVCLILPGSRGSEIARLIGPFGAAAAHLARLDPAMRFVLPASPRVEARVRAAVGGWSVPCEVVSGEDAKWQAFGEADVAIAASGTVLLELAIVGVPHMSSYKLDFIARRLVHKLTTWSMALPNLIAGHVVVEEQYNNHVLPERLARTAANLARDTPRRAAMLAEFAVIRERMHTDAPPSATAADVVLAVLART